MTKLSIIVPVYNVEEYIHACIDSIFRQGLDDEIFEVIIVNDGTQDRSMEMIKDIISQHHNITIINQDNQGLSVARNNGLAVAKGKYILFVDSDDVLINDSLSYLLDKAIESKVDLVVADYMEINNNEINNTLLYTKNNIKAIEKSGVKLFLEDIDPHDCHVWHTLYKREFLQHNNITFVKGIFYEDIPFTHECAIKANKCLRIHIPIYIYRKGNELTITSFFNKKRGLDFGTAIVKTWGLTYRKELSPIVVAKLKQNMFVSFSTLICVVTHNIPILSDRMEILDNIKNNAPDIYFGYGLKQTFVSILFRKMPYIYLTLRLFYAKTFEKTIWVIRRKIKK